MRRYARSRLYRRITIIGAALLAALAFAGVAQALIVYANWQTFSPGEQKTGGYEGSAPWWDYNEISKSTWAYGRVAFIDTGGSWHCSYTDANLTTSCQILSGYQYSKTPLCKNNDVVYYQADCAGAKRS